jgi:hypothetical protein
MKLITLLQIAGLLHFGLLLAGASMPKAVNLRQNLALLPPFIRQLFWVYFSFIGLTLVSLGGLTLASAPAMAAGEPVARKLCIFIAAFWLMRLVAAWFIFDVRPYLTNWFYRLGYQATNVTFIYLAAIYTWVAVKGGAL